MGNTNVTVEIQRLRAAEPFDVEKLAHRCAYTNVSYVFIWEHNLNVCDQYMVTSETLLEPTGAMRSVLRTDQKRSFVRAAVAERFGGQHCSVTVFDGEIGVGRLTHPAGTPEAAAAKHIEMMLIPCIADTETT